MDSEKGFSLLEVMVALSVASIALSWYLYCLSQVYYTKTRARELLHLYDLAYGEALYFLKDFPARLPSEAQKEQLEEGFFLVRLKVGKTSWEFLFSSKGSSEGGQSLPKDQNPFRTNRSGGSGPLLERPEKAFPLR